MKKLNVLFAAIAMILMSTVEAQIDLPAPSPKSVVMQEVGLADVTVEYYRPKARGRKIFGSGSDYLVPFGQLWRTGANQGTIISFDKDLMVGESKLAAGEYMILTVPGASEWEIIFYSNPRIGGNMSAFKEEDVAARFKAKSMNLSQNVDTWTIGFANISDDSGSADLMMAWENTAVGLTLSNDFDAEVMAAIEKGTQPPLGNYLAAANYYLSTDRDLDKALEWINMYLAENPKQFWNVHTKAQIQAKLGDKKGAVATAKESIELAKANQGGDFGYIKRNEDLIASLK